MKNKKNTAMIGEGCRVEAIVSFDDRGQLVLPKEIRTKYNLESGDRLALISCIKEGGDLCCFTLVPTKELQGMIQDFLGPVFKDMIPQ